MTTIAQKKLEQTTLDIKDLDLAKSYQERRYPEINKISTWIVYSRICYGAIMIFQLFTEGTSIMRPGMYFAFTIVHYCYILVCEKQPWLQKFHSSIISLTFSSFVLNNPIIYPKRSEHLSLMIGYISICYLSSTFVSSNWVTSCIGQIISTIIITYYYCFNFDYELLKLAPAMLMVIFSCCCNSYYVELKEKQEFLEIKSSEVLQRDLKKVLQVLPEGVMIYKRFGNPHIKLWNNELERLFDFKSLPKNTATEGEDSPDIVKDGKRVENVDDMARGQIKDIMAQKILLPISKVVEGPSEQMSFQNPILQRKPISIETALIYGESDRFYSIVDPNSESLEQTIDQDEETEKSEVVGLSVINIQYDNDPCSMILFRNWTHNFRYQFAKAESQLQEMITATVSHEMRTPINAIMTQLDSLDELLEDNNKGAQKMTRIIKNSSQLLLYLVNDMLDVYMLKNRKFQIIEEKLKLKKMMTEILDMFILQAMAKNIDLRINIAPGVPQTVVSDQRRLKQVIINLTSNALKFTHEGFISIECDFNRETQHLEFSVVDTGIGIRKADQVKLFKMFGKLKSSKDQNQQGIGLGLNVCKRIVSVFNGDMSCTSEKDKGSKFNFSFQVKEYNWNEEDTDGEGTEININSQVDEPKEPNTIPKKDEVKRSLDKVKENSGSRYGSGVRSKEYKFKFSDLRKGEFINSELKEKSQKGTNSMEFGFQMSQSAGVIENEYPSINRKNSRSKLKNKDKEITITLADKMNQMDRTFPIHTVAEIEKNLTQRYKTETGLEKHKFIHFHDTVSDERSIKFNKSRKDSRKNKPRSNCKKLVKYKDGQGRSLSSLQKQIISSGKSLKESSLSSQHIEHHHETILKNQNQSVGNKSQLNKSQQPKQNQKNTKGQKQIQMASRSQTPQGDRLSSRKRQEQQNQLQQPLDNNIKSQSRGYNDNNYNQLSHGSLPRLSSQAQNQNFVPKQKTSGGTKPRKKHTGLQQLNQLRIPNSQHANISSTDKIEVMIVDDNVFNLQTLQSMISIKFGIDSKTVHSGSLALQIVEQEINLTKSNEQTDGGELDPPFKIIFMDCNMPVMDGFETTRKILEMCQRNNAEKPYIVALTAHDVRSDKNIKAQCYENGMNQCLSKPISFDGIKELFIRLNVNFKQGVKDKKV